jgi:hypothetical protein
MIRGAAAAIGPGSLIASAISANAPGVKVRCELIKSTLVESDNAAIWSNIVLANLSTLQVAMGTIGTSPSKGALASTRISLSAGYC